MRSGAGRTRDAARPPDRVDARADRADAGSTAAGAPPAPRPYPWRAVLGAFVAVSAVLTTVATLGWARVPRESRNPLLDGPAWLDAWFQFDAGWYHRIATVGYDYVPGQQSSIAFFPTYPLGVRALATVVGDAQVAGTLLAVVAGGASVLLFGRWAWQRLDPPAATAAVGVLMLYPYALFLYGAMYADSLFLLSAVSAFLLVERRWYWAAGLVGALATAGRPVGMAVAVGLAVRALEHVAADRAAAASATPAPEGADARAARGPWPSLRELVAALPAVRWRQSGVLLALAGLGAWCLYLGLRFGNPLAFVEVESAPGWDQGVGPRTWFKVAYVETVARGQWGMAALLGAQAVACVCAVLLLRRVHRLFGWGYTAYAAVVLLIPIVGTDDFMGTGRYVLVAFPVMAAGGHLLAGTRHRWLRPAFFLASASALVVLTSFFGQSVMVS